MIQCYLCLSNDLETLQEKLRHGIERSVLRCRSCGLVFLDPQKKNLAEFYRKEYRKLHSPVLGREVDAKEFFEIYEPLQAGRLAKIKPFLKPDFRVLDIGSSAGMFLNAVKPHVAACVGVEFDQVFAEYARERVGITVHTTPLEDTDLPKHSFDMISAMEVFEHIEDPLAFLQTVREYLKPDGILYFEVPNHDDVLLSIFDVPGYREFYYREPHIFYYNPKTLEQMLAKGGFTGTIAPAGFEPNVLNQMQWILTGKPQGSATTAYGPIHLPFHGKTDPAIRALFNKLIEDFGQAYQALLDEHLRSSHLVFIGRQS